MTVINDGHIGTSEASADSGFKGAPGSIAVVRDQEWLVTAVEPTADGFFVHVTGLSELVRDTSAVFSTALDRIDEVDPTAVTVVADPSERFRRSRLWLEAMFRKTPIAVTDPGFGTAQRGLAKPLDYQVKAVAKALDPDKLRPRILLADAVGLGKTIEIGMILSELVRRGRGDRILIVTPKHVLEQMQMELWTRFALPFVRLDSAGIQRIRQVLPASRNPFTYFKRVIISIDTLKSDRYIANLQKQRWDAVVIDESHNVTNTASQNNRLARLLSKQTDALILASATPHNGRADSFAELVRMLDPTAVSPEGEPDYAEVAKLVIRRHRHHPDVAGEVGSDWAERQPPHNVVVPATAAEDAIARELEDVWLWPESGSSPYSGQNSSLFPWTLAKAYLSSPAALLQSVRERRRRIDAAVPKQATELAALDRLADLTEAVPMASSAKYVELRTQLDEMGVSRSGSARVVIFAERVATLTALAEQLAADLTMTSTRGADLGQVAVLHGGLSDSEQTEIVESFKLESSPIRILVTGDVASEGVNLHSQCHQLIHYDIPWSLIRIEQRNGRIDRYGQKHRPRITTLLLTPSTAHFAGDLRVLARLVDREHEAHQALGDTASLMGTYDVKAEEESIRQVLAGQKELEAVVKTVDEVAAGTGLDSFFAQLALGGIAQDPPAEQPASEGFHGAGVYDSEFEFLSDALHESYVHPQNAPKDGVDWAVHKQYSIASLTPPKDLRQRLDVLPQDYLKARSIRETYKLAYTPARGEQELVQARSGASTSTWPEAHYLAPLHPILDWAADRALSELGRSQIYAVRGAVPFPTILVQVTQTNLRGQVVAAGYYTVAFPVPGDPGASLVEPHTGAHEAVAELAIAQVNTGDIDGASNLQPLVAAAVHAADANAKNQAESVRAESADRIRAWVARSEAWQHEAGALIQRADLRDQSKRIAEEKELAEAMNPARRLARPLMVVVPEDFDPAALGSPASTTGSED
ncbi:DEAD/DEAH box helicase [Tsukamurella asaccharolytica]|uniref:DEAD/DEAH box helicase n=1 Tax=Tsukamurella asaccharolytica TaxID=2592067 RepID=A0A5C5RCW0_9ACTN|nr:helicase-related protein [Tsukamurella asaccharolytica]TWS20025.1 DEAD/DEAH box helicase [Tsukamurella asaccharolytica]